ncbi:hypothetical protein V1512DRAFT_256461 [Lipomyces arxii]|uniref:uncharacterized protein n=1 Tax=Lipomyces arxii TaxID=56418 RepID=UPI0034CD9230
MSTKSIVRSIKNVTNGYSRPEVMVRNATSNAPWGPSGSEMDEIAELTHERLAFFDVMNMIERRLNDKGKNWRHVMKALIVLDYCLHVGSEDVVRWAKDNMFIIKTLREFQFYDVSNVDQGQNVRSKAKNLTSFLKDDERIRTERANRNFMREKLLRAGYETYRSNQNGTMDGYRRRRATTLPQRSSFDYSTSEDEEEKEKRDVVAEYENRVEEKKEQKKREQRTRAVSAAASTRRPTFSTEKESHVNAELDKKNSELLFGAVAVDKPASATPAQTQTLVAADATQAQIATPTGIQYVQNNAATGYQFVPQLQYQQTYLQPQATGYSNMGNQQMIATPQQFPQLTGRFPIQPTSAPNPYSLAAYPTGQNLGTYIAFQSTPSQYY